MTLTPLAQYWETRLLQRGRCAVAHAAWTSERYEVETPALWDWLKPEPDTGRLLDFGCGVGRFSVRLAQIGYVVTGVDISLAMVSQAQRDALPVQHAGASVCFTLVVPGQPLPFPDGYFAAFFCSTVLLHVRDDDFARVCAEIRRVLHPNAQLTIFENTARMPVRTSPSGHVVFRSSGEYVAAFPGIAVHETRMVEGEKHSLMRGHYAP